MVLKLDFRDDEIAQDMICLIMNDKNLQTPEKAVQSAVNEKLKNRLIRGVSSCKLRCRAMPGMWRPTD